MNKAMMIAQGYVPATCVLHEDLAGPLIFSEVSAGRDPCAGCNHDRAKCGGRPRVDEARQAYHSMQRMEEMTLNVKLSRAMGPTFENPPYPGTEEWLLERRLEAKRHQLELDAESLEISGKIYGLDEEVK